MFSPLTDRVVSSPQRSSRQGATIDTMLWHHQAGTDSEGVLRAMASGSRQVSANYVITNEGEIVGVVDEGDRAWTSGSPYDSGKGAAWDRRSITVEVENQSLAPDYRISPAAAEACAKLAADLYDRRGIKLDRSHHLGHRELWEKYQASYPTVCPGGLSVSAIVERAIIITKGTEPTMKLVRATSAAAATATAPAIISRQRYLIGELTSAAVPTAAYSAVYGPSVELSAAEIQTLIAAASARRAQITQGLTVTTDLAPVLQAIAAGEQQDVAAVAAVLAKLDGVDEATAATLAARLARA